MHRDKGTGHSCVQIAENPVAGIEVKADRLQTIAGAILLARIGTFAVKINLGGIFVLGMKVDEDSLGFQLGKVEFEIDQRSQLRRPSKGGPKSQTIPK